MIVLPGPRPARARAEKVSSLWPARSSRRRSAAGSRRNTSGPDGVDSRCTRAASRRDRPAALPGHGRAPEGDPVKLVEHGLVEALDDGVGLRALGLGAGVIDVLHRQVQLVLVALGYAAVLGAAVGQHPVERTPCSSKNGITRSLSR